MRTPIQIFRPGHLGLDLQLIKLSFVLLSRFGGIVGDEDHVLLLQSQIFENLCNSLNDMVFMPKYAVAVE